jgi:hypothetical protein
MLATRHLSLSVKFKSMTPENQFQEREEKEMMVKEEEDTEAEEMVSEAASEEEEAAEAAEVVIDLDQRTIQIEESMMKIAQEEVATTLRERVEK